MHGTYNPWLVSLSVAVAVFASYTALGIWSMHFVGMLPFRVPGMAILYDALMALPTLVAILASALALFVVSRPEISRPALAAGAVAMGVAVAGMHYIGMASMRMPARIDSGGAVAMRFAIVSWRWPRSAAGLAAAQR